MIPLLAASIFATILLVLLIVTLVALDRMREERDGRYDPMLVDPMLSRRDQRIRELEAQLKDAYTNIEMVLAEAPPTQTSARVLRLDVVRPIPAASRAAMARQVRKAYPLTV